MDFNTTPVGVFFNDPDSSKYPKWGQTNVQEEKSKAWAAAMLESPADAVDSTNLTYRREESNRSRNWLKSIKTTLSPPQALQLVYHLVESQLIIGKSWNPDSAYAYARSRH